VYIDCKNVLTQGQTTSGVYTIKPDNQSAFQVYCDMDTDVVVGGQCSSAEMMDQLTYITTGLTISKGLETHVESSGWDLTRYTV